MALGGYLASMNSVEENEKVAEYVALQNGTHPENYSLLKVTVSSYYLHTEN